MTTGWVGRARTSRRGVVGWFARQTSAVLEAFTFRRLLPIAVAAEANLGAATATVRAARRERKAAEALWRERLYELSRAHAERALELAENALALLVPGSSAEERLETLEAAPSTLRAYRAAHDPVPERPSVPSLLEACEAIDDAVALVCRGSARLRQVLLARRLAVVGVPLLLVLFLVRPRITASATQYWGFDERFSSSRAVDGDPSTEWLLPDKIRGDLVVRFFPARDVQRIGVLNATNPPYGDRGTATLEIIAYSGSTRLASTQAPMSEAERTSWQSFPLRASGVDRLVFRVLAWHGKGGGLAEVRTE